MAKSPLVPGVFVTGTSTGVGMTVVAGAIAQLARQKHKRVGVFKPIAVGCPRRIREGLASPDAEFLAHCADCPFDMPTISPVRYAQTMVPAMAAEVERRPVDLDAIRENLARIAAGSDVMIVEGVGGLGVPIADKLREASLAVEFGWPIVVVAPPGGGTVNQSLLSVREAKTVGLKVAAVVLNRYRPDDATLAEERNPDAAARFGRISVYVVPEDEATRPSAGRLGKAVLDAVRQISLPGIIR
jgi:dethiobiotin synthetase